MGSERDVLEEDVLRSDKGRPVKILNYENNSKGDI